ncbi:unnamed protein product [Arctia plantaginis]|uniref:Uncharacterized protein n=1 Tax=Arctia plantaginis TaxID=874455 RepID=A0A8S1ATB7_ARCPL|nr:unnamed protein product [Arctia plantaginis]CAB3251573.1 unnamed protein product [Arctia plantaginis]
MPFPCCPKFKRCCWCTRHLRVACVFIVLWSMLATCHSCGILMWPACPTQYTDESNPLFKPSFVFMWILLILNMLTVVCSFGFLLTLLFGRFLSFAEAFLSLGLLSAFFMLCHGVITLTMFLTRHEYNFDCWNPSDGIAHIIYFIVWSYFICIANSYVYQLRGEY